MSVDIYTMKYCKADMGQIPEQERLLHFMAGQLVNEVNLFNRLTIAALNYSTGEDPIAHANTAAAITLAKQLAGRLYEAGLILTEPKFAVVLDDYARLMPVEAVEALSSLRSYFASQNLLADLRNKVTAHVDLKTFRSGYLSLPDDAELVDFFGTEHGNTLHFGAFTVGAYSLLRITKQQDIRVAIDAVMNEAVRTASLFMSLFNSVMQMFFQRHFPKKLEALRGQTPIQLMDLPDLATASIPAFVVGG